MGVFGPSPGRLRFYVDLEKEIVRNKKEVGEEVEALFMEAGRWNDSDICIWTKTGSVRN